MAVIVVNEGECRALDAWAVLLSDGGYSFFLWTNDDMPALDWEFTDITEATFPGYARALVTAFTTATINGDGQAQAECAVKEWLKESGMPDDETVYGWGVVRNVDDNMQLVERFATPRTMFVVGDQILVHAVLTAQSRDEP